MQKFFSELQRRKVLRLGSAYLVVAWAFVQGASTIEAVLNLPPWFDTLVFAIMATGFPIGLALSWFYEFTPDGIRRTLVSTDGTMHAPKALDWTLLALAIGVGIFIAVEAVVPGVNEKVAGTTAATPPAVTAAALTPVLGDKSIAVLPFANLSPDKANDYFADGLTEELLNILAKMGGLKVISRTSSFAFKGKTVALPEVAKTLGVRHVLEGSIRRDGDDVRVTAQLIDVATDTHLWSETFDRKIEKIFAIQDEIARTIAGKLNIEVALTAATDAPTENVDAYRAYLEARELFRHREKQDMARGLDLLKTATDLDPKFAEAHALAAAIHYVQAVSFPMFETEAPLARDAATKAHELKPTLALPHAIQGGLDMAGYKWASGAEHLKRAVELDPSDTTARLWLGTALLELGRLDAGANTLHEAARLDPLYEIVEAWVARAEFARGNRQDALRRAEDLARKDTPLARFAAFMLARDAYDRGDAAEAERHYRRSEDTDMPKELVEAVAKALRSRDSVPAAVKAAKTAAAKDPTIQPAAYYALLKADDALIDWLGERFDEPDQGSTLLLFFAELWPERHKSLQNDPRFQTILRKRGLIDYWKATSWPDRCKSDGADGFVCE